MRSSTPIVMALGLLVATPGWAGEGKLPAAITNNAAAATPDGDAAAAQPSTPPDPTRGLTDLEDPEQQFLVGQRLLLGLDENDRPNKAFRRPAEANPWLRKAAEQGHPKGQASLAMALLLGRGTEKNLDEAIVWLRKAADQGHPKAFLELGILYRDGKGVPEDRVRALMFLTLASQEGSPAALFMEGAQARRMSPEERQEARKLAGEWRRAHGMPEFRRPATASADAAPESESPEDAASPDANASPEDAPTSEREAADNATTPAEAAAETATAAPAS